MSHRRPHIRDSAANHAAHWKQKGNLSSKRRFTGRRTHGDYIDEVDCCFRQCRSPCRGTSNTRILAPEQNPEAAATFAPTRRQSGSHSGSSDGKVDQSIQSSAAIWLALGVLDGKVDQSNTDLAIIRGELQLIREALVAQAEVNGGLQLQVEANVTSCASGAVQCASAVPPSSFNQIPVELQLLVLRDQVSVTNLEIANFDMTTAFSPVAGPM